MPTVPVLQTAADLSASQIAGAASALVPTGVVLPFAGSSAPAGWLLCSGTPISRSTYADLFTALSTAHGDGSKNADGTASGFSGTHFNLPDLRGRFLRGTDNMGTAASRDPDRATRTAANTGGNTGNSVGSIQTDDFKSHRHGLISTTASTSGVVDSSAIRDNASTTNTVSAFTGGNETRPINVNLNYIIKI